MYTIEFDLSILCALCDCSLQTGSTIAYLGSQLVRERESNDGSELLEFTQEGLKVDGTKRW
jgi:hypothetical protein